MKIAFLLYPTSKVNAAEDSSFWMMLELVRRGHEVFYFESRHLVWSDGVPKARLFRARLDRRKGFLPSILSAAHSDLSRFDCIFIRKEPPFDNGYLHALQLLEKIKHRSFILNDPAGIAMANEKLFILRFPKYIPETFVTSDMADAKKFVKALGKRVVIKRLRDKGGAGIFSTYPGDENLPSLVETATDFGKEAVMLQRFIPARSFGDKRIMILDGKIIGGMVRRPPAYDFRANIGVGASFGRAAFTAADRRLVENLAPELCRHGLHFVGIDVIGKYLTEVNVTSPAGIADVILLEKRHPERDVADFIEARCGV
jgi:glutathione synthase